MWAFSCLSQMLLPRGELELLGLDSLLLTIQESNTLSSYFPLALGKKHQTKPKHQLNKNRKGEKGRSKPLNMGEEGTSEPNLHTKYYSSVTSCR